MTGMETLGIVESVTLNQNLLSSSQIYPEVAYDQPCSSLRMKDHGIFLLLKNTSEK